jgi:hypothetical protein
MWRINAAIAPMSYSFLPPARYRRRVRYFQRFERLGADSRYSAGYPGVDAYRYFRHTYLHQLKPSNPYPKGKGSRGFHQPKNPE